MAVPSVVLQDAELRKPLCDEVEMSDDAGAIDRPGHMRGPRDLDRGRFTRTDRTRQRHGHHRLVALVVIVRRDEMLGGRQVCREGSGKADGRDVYARALGIGRVVGVLVRRSPSQSRFAHVRRAVVAPRVPVQMKAQLGGRRRGDVAPHERLGCRNRVRGWIEARGDRVAGVARRERRRDDALGGRRRRPLHDRKDGDECAAHARECYTTAVFLLVVMSVSGCSLTATR